MKGLTTEWEELPRNAAEQAAEEAHGNYRNNGETPARWFNKKFPALAKDYDEAVLEHKDQETRIVSVRDLNEDFLAATLGEHGTPDAPTVFVPTEERFYTYSSGDGIFMSQREPVMLARLSALLLSCARDCTDNAVDTRPLKFRFRDSGNLSGVIRKARGLLEVSHDFFAADLTEFIPCANGMLRLSDKKLLPFSPSYRRRNKLAVRFEASATCPLFLDTLMRPALDPDELDLLRRWCGLALIGVNLAQKIVILMGTPGGGKGTFVDVLVGIIGQVNLASLRPQLLAERFELGRFLRQDLALWRGRTGELFESTRGERNEIASWRRSRDSRTEKLQRNAEHHLSFQCHHDLQLAINRSP